MFLAELRELVCCADLVIVGSYEVEEPGRYLRPEKIVLELPDDTRLAFDDQKVSVEHGECVAVDAEGERHCFEFRVRRPLQAADLDSLSPPAPSSSPLPRESEAKAPLGILEATRSPELYPALRALLRNEVARLVTSAHFEYPLDGEEVVLMKEHQAELEKVLARVAGRRTLKLREKRLAGREGEIALCLDSRALQALTVEMLALLANLTPHDLASLPAPLEVQQRQL